MAVVEHPFKGKFALEFVSPSKIGVVRFKLPLERLSEPEFDFRLEGVEHLSEFCFADSVHSVGVEEFVEDEVTLA